ncbi:hypothetical protein [Lacinutrix jangbogonensis]|uniref:hypothetical protein n=1 Tax=Lacinutrix jangbogonensis TaxID=1469557 RepID=UPI00053EF41E|nr:hypothetical protein [Lacinutrix jangbogonensis]
MRPTNFLIIIIISCFSYSQEKTYNFDYVLEYENNNNIDSTGSIKSYVFVNSKDNSFVLTYTDYRDHGYLRFLHHNAARISTKMDNKLFFAAESIRLGCGFQTKMAYHKKTFKWHSFKIEKDTIIKNDTLKYYTYNAYNKKKKRSWRSKHLGHHFIIQPNTEHILPFFYSTNTYDKWKVSKDLPKGIFRRNYFLTKKGAIGEGDFRLLSVTKYKKQIILPVKSCSKQIADRIIAQKQLEKILNNN